jgi:hypothetical protein
LSTPTVQIESALQAKTSGLQRIPLATVCLLVFSASFLIYASSPQGRPVIWDSPHENEMIRTAESLVYTGSYANPYYSLRTGPTAHVAPGYVFFYAALLKLFGFGFTFQVVLWALNVGFLALQFALLPALSDRLGLGMRTGVLAAAFGVVFQPYRTLPEWESLATGALVVSACLMTVSHLSGPMRRRQSVLLGLLWGIAMLTNPLCVLLLLAWPLIVTRHSPALAAARGRTALAITFGAAILTCAPWFVRNGMRFGSFVFVRDNLGLELSVSNNPCALPTLGENIASGCHSRTHPNGNAAIAAELVSHGEVRFNREQLRQALSWMASNPRAFLLLTARRVRKYWFPNLGSMRYAVPCALLTLLSPLGLAILLRRKRPAGELLTATLLLYPLVHYFVQFDARYRYPIFWATFLPAAYLLVCLLPRRESFTGHPNAHS